MEDNTSINKKAHKLILNNRSCGNLTGVSDVLSFDENEIIQNRDAVRNGQNRSLADCLSKAYESGNHRGTAPFFSFLSDRNYQGGVL